MNAKTAAQLSKAAETRKKNVAHKKRQREEERRAAQAKEAFPQALADARKKIAEAVKAGDSHVILTDTIAAGAVGDALRKDGYQVFYGSEECNMGDSAAPCMTTFLYMHVRWRTEA